MIHRVGENPRALEQISSARERLPLRNFLSAVNGTESVFQSVSARTWETSPETASGMEAFEFASQIYIVIAQSPLNLAARSYTDLAAVLKELLERAPATTARAVLHISPCKFAEQRRDGFLLGIQLIGNGESARQAETRWGLACVQQALLFSARAIRQHFGVE